MRTFALSIIWLIVFGAALSFAQTEGELQLFNGKDLTGWSYLPTTDAQKEGRARWLKGDPNAPPWPIVDTKVNFDTKVKTIDGRFVAKDGYLTVTVPEEGRKIQMLYSDLVIKGDFDLQVRFRAAHNCDSGLFIRGHQLQVRDYPNAGPYKNLKKFKQGDWNLLSVSVRGSTARCTCNGEVLEEAFKVPGSGPIGIEGDRGMIEYSDFVINTESLSSAPETSSAIKMAPWELQLHGDAESTMSSTKDTVVIDTARVGEEAWHVQLLRPKLDLEEGSSYQVSFEIKSDTEGSRVLAQGMISKPDWHEIGLHESIKPGKEFSTHEFSFKATDTIKGENRIGLVLGYQPGKIIVRNFTVRKLK